VGWPAGNATAGYTAQPAVAAAHLALGPTTEGVTNVAKHVAKHVEEASPGIHHAVPLGCPPLVGRQLDDSDPRRCSGVMVAVSARRGRWQSVFRAFGRLAGVERCAPPQGSLSLHFRPPLGCSFLPDPQPSLPIISPLGQRQRNRDYPGGTPPSCARESG
jgi:hypothetical protein